MGARGGLSADDTNVAGAFGRDGLAVGAADTPRSCSGRGRLAVDSGLGADSVGTPDRQSHRGMAAVMRWWAGDASTVRETAGRVTGEPQQQSPAVGSTQQGAIALTAPFAAQACALPPIDNIPAIATRATQARRKC